LLIRSSIAGSGLAAASLRFDRAAARIADTAASPDGAANLAGDVVEQMEAGYAFDANLRVLRTADAMLGALLDVTA